MMLIIANPSILNLISRHIAVGIHYQSSVIRKPVVLITA